MSDNKSTVIRDSASPDSFAGPKKNQQACKPGSVSQKGFPSFIWDNCCQLPLAAYPFRLSCRSGYQGGQPCLSELTENPEYTWPYSSWGARLRLSPNGPVSSYLTFSPLPLQSGAVIFCSTSHTLADIFPLGSMMPCAARTFLPPQTAGSDGTAC